MRSPAGFKHLIGIDPGVNTGLCHIAKCRGGRDIIDLRSTGILKAIKYVEEVTQEHSVFIRVEDARKRKWYGGRSNFNLQGVGSVKRDCGIWQEYLRELCMANLNHEYEMIHPIKGATKLTSIQFQRMTGYVKTTNEHKRDACMLIWGL